ncbi:MAG: hypothetical protein K2M05_08995, partial [Paramuribaculum sp.]|nr:hypothetical protein [Paramuribaculum sp.]
FMMKKRSKEKNKRVKHKKLWITLGSVLGVFVAIFIALTIYVNIYYSANDYAIEELKSIENRNR